MAGTHFGGRTLARSQALQLLFQAEATGRTVHDVLEGPYALDEGPLDDYGERIALGADAMLRELDAIISDTSANWSVSRMPAVDRNLVRLALYEMLEVPEVDTAVAIDECVELAKAYGIDESSRFVNGLLGKVARRLEAGEDVVGEALAMVREQELEAQKLQELQEQQARELQEQQELQELQAMDGATGDSDEPDVATAEPAVDEAPTMATIETSEPASAPAPSEWAQV